MLFLYIILVVLCCWCWKLRCCKDSALLQPPTLSGRLPIIGHAHMLIRHDIHKVIVATLKEFLDNGITTFYIGWKKIYVITDPESMKTISDNCLEKEDLFYKFLKPFLGDGLATVGSVSTWKTHRKFLNPVFGQTKLKSFIDVFNGQARCLVKKLDLQLGKPFYHEDVLKLNNLETIGMTAIGMADNENGLYEKYLPMVIKVQEIFKYRIQRPWFYNDTIFNMSSLKREQDETCKQLWDLSVSIIKNKRKEMKRVRRYEDHETIAQKSFLELILETTNETISYTDEQIIPELITFIGTGHETTASHLNIMLIVLGSHQDAQEEIYNEIIALDKGLDRDLDLVDLSKLVYTEAVIKETLRLYTTVPWVARHIEKTIQLNNYTLPANSTCILNLYGLNRHPVWGPDADQFRPERWLDKARPIDMNHFGSFSLGRRNCIGKSYAMLSMKVALVHLIRRYKVSADMSKVEFKWRLIIYPASGNQYTLERRIINNE